MVMSDNLGSDKGQSARLPRDLKQRQAPSSGKHISLTLAALLFTLCYFLPRYVPGAAPATEASVQAPQSSEQWTDIWSRAVDEPPVEAHEIGDKWEDNVWPIRSQTYWDISTSFPYPRNVSFTVTEGSWLRLDIHPVNSDLIFDMLGDIYCLPGSLWAESPESLSTLPLITARKVLGGVPWDRDPQFSPTGDTVAFTSDAGLGVENIWIMPYSSCEDMNLDGPSFAIGDKQQEESMLLEGVPETAERRNNRLHREGRLEAQRVTNETYRYLTEPRFHPSGDRIVATKWYTSSRSLGAGEGWEYPVPSLGKSQREDSIPAGHGRRITSRSLPLGWDEATQYGNQQIGPEMNIWLGEDAIIYSKNAIDESTFQYSKDIHSGAYAIYAKNLTTGSTVTLVSPSPGGASRPELSPDGKTLAFVRRDRDKEYLVLKNLESGTMRYVWDGLSYDLTLVSAPMGTYPQFSFTPSGNAIVIWAKGQFYYIPLSTNSAGELVPSDTLGPQIIPFAVKVEKKLSSLSQGPEGGYSIVDQETSGVQKLGVVSSIRPDYAGEKVLFAAGGLTFYQENISTLAVTGSSPSSSAEPKRIPVSDPTAPYYSPSWITEADGWVIHAKWSDTVLTETFELAHLPSGTVIPITGLPLGRYFNPIISPPMSGSSIRKLAFVKTGGDTLTGNIISTAKTGFWTADVEIDFTALVGRNSTMNDTAVMAQNVRYQPIPLNPNDEHLNVQFLSAEQVLIQLSGSTYTFDFPSSTLDVSPFLEWDALTPPERAQISVSTRMSTEVAAQPIDGPEWVAFVDFKHVYVAPYGSDEYWSKPGNSTPGLARLSLDGGHDIIWSGDGKMLFWTTGPNLYAFEISQLSKCNDEIEADTITFGYKCTTELFKKLHLDMPYLTEIGRLRADIEGLQSSDVVVLRNATLLTMESGDEQGDIVQNAVLTIKGGIIESVSTGTDENSEGMVIDVQGAFVLPGFIDMHAHWDGFGDRYPAKSWEMEAFLGYGVTTMHNPSSDNVAAFREHDRIESGQLIGPRTYHVGNIFYGGGAPDYALDAYDMADSYSALLRLKAEGGNSSLSYKNYQIPVRGARQRLLLASRDLDMLCVPEGGMNHDWDLTFVIDGMTTVEHTLPIITWYDDVASLMALSGTGITPTHVVNYGGPFGEQYVWATHDVPNDEKLRLLTRHDYLETLSESTARPLNSWAVFNSSASVANMVKKGLKAFIGAHGENPKGHNFHAEMFFTAAGGLTNYETLRAATSDAARTLGIFQSLGSLTPGKLADLVVYEPGVNVLQEEIDSTRKLRYVARGGRFWDASTMEEVWPVEGRKQTIPPINIG